ncbi:MAG: outer membrane lipoprotein-sorting protein [Bacteroidota bacterium]
MRIKQLLFLLFVPFCLSAQSTLTADQIIKKYQAATAINDLQSTLKYKNTSKKGRVQERTLEQYILQKDAATNTYNFLLKFVAPADIRGTSTLTVQHAEKADDQWLYLPALRSAKRISASKKGDRFMGTEMTYEDLSNYLSEPTDEYSYELVGEEKIGDRACYQIKATPLAAVKTQYSQRILWIDKATFLQVQAHFFNQKEELMKVFSAKEIKKVVGTDFHKAHYIQLENRLTKNKTEVFYSNFVINKGVDKSIFSKSYIETL